jgi:hypothetical protein
MKLESREVGAARLGKRSAACPGCDSQEVDRDGCDDMLQARFDKTSIACAAQSAAPDRLGVGAFDAGPSCVGLPEFLRCLSLSHPLERLMKIASLEANDTWLLLRSCALALRSPRPMRDWSLVARRYFACRLDM